MTNSQHSNISILWYPAQVKNRKELRLIVNEEEYFVRRSMRLHSCYFSKQNLETTVVDQGMLEMLFNGALLLAMFKNNASTPRLYTTVYHGVK